MGWFTHKKKELAVDVRPGRVSEPDQPGLSGTIGRLSGFYDVAVAGFSFELLEVLERLSIFNADISQACKIMVNLGNTGHEIEVSGGRIEAAVERLNELSARVYHAGGGMDGLVNHFMRQIPLMGALSAEWVIEDNIKDGIKDAVAVPVRQIRFRNEDGTFRPYQYTGKGMGADAYVGLNPVTYSYAAIMTLDGSPYGVPLFLGALKNIEIQLNGIDNLDHILKKVGMMGFLDVKLTPPQQKPQESDDAYRQRLASRMASYAKAYQENFFKGVAVHFDDQEIKHTSVSGAAAGAVGLFNLNEEQICSGLDLDPSLLGRSYSTTETYAEVAFARLLSTLFNVRRLVKRFIEKGYGLDLNLVGIPADVSVHFNGNAAFKEGEAVSAEETKVDAVIKKRNAGFIDDDEAARELGYDAATGARDSVSETGLTAPKRFVFDVKSGGYKYHPDVLTVTVQHEHMSRRMGDNYLAAARSILAKPEDLAVQAALKAAQGDYENAEDFAAAVWGAFGTRLKKALAKVKAGAVAAKYVADLWKYHRYEDTSFHFAVSKRRLTGGIDLRLVDANALRYLTAIDKFYMGEGNYLADHPRVGKKFINWLQTEYTSKGLNIKDSVAFRSFSKAFPTLVETTAFDKIEQLVKTTVSRVQNFGQTLKLYEIGAVRYRIVGPRTAPICDYCRAMLGRVFEVEAAAKRLAAVVEKGFESVDQLPGFLPNSYTVETVKKMSDAELQAAGFESPPFHPKCRHRKAMEN